MDVEPSTHAVPHESESADVLWHLVVCKTGAIYCDRDDQRNNVSDGICHVERLVASIESDLHHRISWMDVHADDMSDTNRVAQTCWTQFESHQRHNEVPW